MPPASIAVLGGGLTGLSSAFHLSRRFPEAQIIVLNKQTRFGGWVRSDRVQLNGSGETESSVLLEAGPRTLRPNSKPVLELASIVAEGLYQDQIHLLDLKSSLITVPKTSPAAKNRYLFSPEWPGIQPIPTSFSSLLFSPLGRILLPAVAREPFRPRNRPPHLTDESVNSFLARRFGVKFAAMFGSALVHGIYAADSRKLSVRTAFPTLWEAEERGRGSVVAGFLRPKKQKVEEYYELGDVPEAMRDVSVYSFKNGIGTLTEALVHDLRQKNNVKLYGGVSVTGLRANPISKKFEVSISSNETLHPTHVVSTLPLPRLRHILSPSAHLPHLTSNPYSSVTVVNLVFPASSSFPLHPAGFGYLVPRPSGGYSSHDSGILGCVFDSSATASQDSSRDVVKLTVMLGGPYPISPEHLEVPTILRHLSYHLGVQLPEPLIVRVHQHQECIPMLGVGHLDRMAELRAALHREPWGGKLEIIGAGVRGVSVGDCVESGREAGKSWTT
ncbi:Protoporphyrinogen oxidase [Leucogyrophana mollusca]|uniref:Protoporphyrinogen oxidase n=1 Tax=Leucogyrophana mollusca TaxID=85980 RepID=A0ACB8BSV8_9AGAM|nr:Protoporphyrinogen oxidase [Leucogyrophana mollusca]